MSADDVTYLVFARADYGAGDMDWGQAIISDAFNSMDEALLAGFWAKVREYQAQYEEGPSNPVHVLAVCTDPQYRSARQAKITLSVEEIH